MKFVTTANDYQSAIDSQSACNLSGIVRSLAEITDRICEEARANGQGTDYVNRHPICRLFAEQIMHLTSGTSSAGTSYGEALKICEERLAELTAQQKLGSN